MTTNGQPETKRENGHEQRQMSAVLPVRLNVVISD